MHKNNLEKLVLLLKAQKVLALPTESVYGLSTILESDAVAKIVTLKKRSANKGFIVLSSKIEHLLRVIDVARLTDEHLAKLQKHYDRATTWVVPVKPEFRWLTGPFESIAVRLTTHPLLSELTKLLDQAIVSTSANISNMPAATSMGEVYDYFAEQVDYIYPQADFVATKPSRLIDLLTGQILRE
ncbi:L-threonylcarbamoyladenylate synthase [Cysteiniphilum sp. 6C5]|uniref:L-threonylcarbamoyladenylate synthase n=1 Tax=unclassified Cysteiniphilum TaxID=2610889 RepID=UPI003F84051F